MAFDLRQIVKEELDANKTTDPHVIAKYVHKRLSDDELHDALDAALPMFVRDVIRARRVANRSGGGGQTGLDAQRDAASSSGRKSSAKAGPSKKARALSWYRKTMAEEVCVDEPRRDWKRFGDCTVEEVQYLASSRREKSDRLIAIAKKYERLAELMKREGASKVSAVPRDTFKELWSS